MKAVVLEGAQQQPLVVKDVPTLLEESPAQIFTERRTTMVDITVSLDTELEDPKLRVIAERGLRTFQLAVHADDVEAR